MPSAVVLEGHHLEDGGRTDYQNGDMKKLSVDVSYQGGLKRNLKNYFLTYSAFYFKVYPAQATAVQFCNDGFKINCPFEAEDKKKSGAKSKSLRHCSFLIQLHSMLLLYFLCIFPKRVVGVIVIHINALVGCSRFRNSTHRRSLIRVLFTYGSRIT